MISCRGRASGFGVDCDVDTDPLEALVSHANAPVCGDEGW
jgi:hypothetical protein